MNPKNDRPHTADTRMPPGPRTPRAINGVRFLFLRNYSVRRWHRRFGDLFSLEVPRLGTIVCARGPELNKRVLTAKADILHGGDNPLGDVLGPGSLFSLDEDAHLGERRKLLPPFHGERMRSYEDLIEEEALREMDRWPSGEEFATIRSFNTITLRIILRAVFGAEGPKLAELQAMLPGMTRLGQWIVAAPFLEKNLGPWSPGARAQGHRERYREIIDSLVDEHLADPQLGERIDILALMLRSDLENEVEIDRDAIAEQLLTLLVAGHETTASSLAWTVERVRRHPAVLRRLQEEARTSENAYRLAVINEVLRVRPVIAFTGRTVVAEPFELEGWELPAGTRILLGIKAVHEDDRFHTEADRFDPERYVGKKPDTYSWLPFGGGMRRCLGAAFAQFEMDIVLRTLLRQFEISPTGARPERESFRGLAYAPSKGGLCTVRRRPAPVVPATSSEASGAPV